MEMALVSAGKKSCGAVAGAGQQQRGQVAPARTQWELQQELQRAAAQRMARQAQQAAAKAKDKATEMGLQAGKYPFPRANADAAQAQVQVKAAEAARPAAGIEGCARLRPRAHTCAHGGFVEGGARKRATLTWQLS